MIRRVSSRPVRALLGRRWLPGVVGLALLVGARPWAASPSPAATAETRIEWRVVNSGVVAEPVRVVALGLPAPDLQRFAAQSPASAAWQRLLSVRVRQADPLEELDLPAIAGTYRVIQDTLEFVPNYPLAAGVPYRAVLRPSQLGGTSASVPATLSEYRAERPAHPPTRVARVYPSAGVLPENLLKFYLEFTGPMSRGDAYTHLRLIDERGETVDLPFLELPEELWSRDLRRLTLLIDPGRIKRGVRPLEEVGPALQSGRRYRLVVDADWPDASGRSLESGFEKPFVVGPPDREPPDPSGWTLRPPVAAIRAPLVIEFPEPLDAAVIRRSLQVRDSSGTTLAGLVELGDEERRWSFVPASEWLAGAHVLEISAQLEDLAGNNPGKPFDVDRFESPTRSLAEPALRLPFTIH